MREQVFYDIRDFIEDKCSDWSYNDYRLKVKHRDLLYLLSSSRDDLDCFVEIKRATNSMDVKVLISEDTLEHLPNFETLAQIFEYERVLYDEKIKKEMEKSKRTQHLLEGVDIVG